MMAVLIPGGVLSHRSSTGRVARDDSDSDVDVDGHLYSVVHDDITDAEGDLPALSFFKAWCVFENTAVLTWLISGCIVADIPFCSCKLYILWS